MFPGNIYLFDFRILKANLNQSKVSGGAIVDGAVGVLAATLTIANSDVNNVGAGQPHLAGALGGIAAWVGLSLDGPSRTILAGLGGRVVFRVTKRNAINGLNANGNFARASAVVRHIGQLEIEDGALSAVGGGSSERNNLGIAVVVHRADGDQLAEVEGIQISLFNDLDKLLNASNVAEDVAQVAKSGVVSLVRQGTAQLAASTNDALVQNDVQENVEGLIHKVQAGHAQVISRLLNRALLNSTREGELRNSQAKGNHCSQSSNEQQTIFQIFLCSLLSFCA